MPAVKNGQNRQQKWKEWVKCESINIQAGDQIEKECDGRKMLVRLKRRVSLIWRVRMGMRHHLSVKQKVRVAVQGLVDKKPDQ